MISSYNSNSRKYYKILSILLFFLVCFTIFFRYAFPVKDADIFYHILYGKYFLEHKTLLADHTIFSWTPAAYNGIYCTWIPDIFFFISYKLSGFSGLIVFRYLCIFSLIFSCYIFSKKLGIHTNPVTWLICLLASLMSYAGIVLKPEIFSFLFFVFLGWNWFNIRKNNTSSVVQCYFFPLLFLIWVNTHGSYIFGIIFILTAAIGELLNSLISPHSALNPKLQKHLLISFLLSLLAIFVSPYGYKYVYQTILFCIPTDTKLNTLAYISAYTSPFFNQDHLGLLKVLNFSIIIFIILVIINFKKIEWSSILLNLVFVYIYTIYARTTYFLGPVYLFSSIALLSQKPTLSSKCHNYLFLIFSSVVLLSISIWLSASTIYQSRYKPEANCWMGFGIAEVIAEKEVDFIEKNYPNARIGNTYNEGAYLIWRLWPDRKVFIDQRHFPYADWINDYMGAVHNRDNSTYYQKLEELIHRYPCDLWLIGHESLSVSQWFFGSDEWQLAFFGKKGAVYVNKNFSRPIPPPIFIPEDLKSLKNYDNGIFTLKWVMMTKNWEASDILLSHMENKFTLPQQVETLTTYRKVFRLLKNFQRK